MQKDILKDILKEIEFIESAVKEKGSINASLMDERDKRAIFQAITNIAVDLHEKLDDETKAIFQKKDLKFSKDTRNFIAHNNRATNLNIVRNFIKFEMVRIKNAICLVFEAQKGQNINFTPPSSENHYANFLKLKKSFISLFSYIVALFFIFCGYLLIKGIKNISKIDIIIWLCFIFTFVLFGVTTAVLHKREKEFNSVEEVSQKQESKENQENKESVKAI